MKTSQQIFNDEGYLVLENILTIDELNTIK